MGTTGAQYIGPLGMGRNKSYFWLKSSEGHIKECSEGQKQNLAPTTHQQFSSVHATNHCIVLPLKKRFIKNLLFQNT